MAPSEVVLAVLVTNTVVSVAGLIVSMQVNMVPSGRTNCIAGTFDQSNLLWISTKGVIPTGFEQPGFDDSAWPAALGQVNYPQAPWNTLTIAAVAPVTI
jgi:hypothetical protein